jgi:hypothetical protein
MRKFQSDSSANRCLKKWLSGLLRSFFGKKRGKKTEMEGRGKREDQENKKSEGEERNENVFTHSEHESFEQDHHEVHTPSQSPMTDHCR